MRKAKASTSSTNSRPKIQYGDSGFSGCAFPEPTLTMTRATSSPVRASALQNPSVSAPNSNLPWLSVRPVSSGLANRPGAKTRTSAFAIGLPSGVANCSVT